MVVSVVENQIPEHHNGPNFVLFPVISSLDNDSTMAEWRDINRFYSLWTPKRYAPRRYPSELGTQIAIPLFNIGASHTSKLYRTAILVFMTYLQTREVTDRRSIEYLARFFQQAQDCIDNRAISELVCASYIIAVYALIGGISPKMAMTHCSQFFRAVVELESGTVDEMAILGDIPPMSA